MTPSNESSDTVEAVSATQVKSTPVENETTETVKLPATKITNDMAGSGPVPQNVGANTCRIYGGANGIVLEFGFSHPGPNEQMLVTMTHAMIMAPEMAVKLNQSLTRTLSALSIKPLELAK